MPQRPAILAAMTGAEIVSGRLHHQLVAGGATHPPATVVRTLGAVQGQDYLASLWAVAVRTPDATERDIEASIARRELVRTWPMRGTLHLVAAADARWMTELMAPKAIRGMAARHRQLGLDEAVFDRARAALTQALHGDRQLTRPAANKVLEAIGIPADARRNHIFGYLSQQSVLCIAAREGKQPTFALLEEWAPAARSLPRDESLAQLALRYFTGHGPATEQDLMWWSGLTAREVREGIALAASDLEQTMVDGVAHWCGPGAVPPVEKSRVDLLPSFDEYLLGYRDRGAVLDPAHAIGVNPGGNGIFNPIVVIGGRVRGTWRRAIKRDRVEIAATPFATFTQRERRAIAREAERYGAFLGLPVVATCA
jgi:Winged helix DNA-binding domain